MYKILVANSDLAGVGAFRSIKPHIRLEELYPNDFKVEIANNQMDINNEDYFKQFDLIVFHKTLGGYDIINFKNTKLDNIVKKTGFDSLSEENKKKYIITEQEYNSLHNNKRKLVLSIFQVYTFPLLFWQIQ